MNKISTKVLSVVLAGMVCWVPPVMGGQSYDIKEMTPQVQKALEGRRDRFDKLTMLKAKGVLGENNKGYVEVLKKEEGAAMMAKEENTDRKAIYMTIAEQNNLTEALSTIEKVFASVQRDKVEPGDMVQTPNGEWVRK